jgi:glycogen operon protein
LYPEGHPLSLNRLLAAANKAWHGVSLGQPDWTPSSHSVALCAEHRNEKYFSHLILNAYWESLEFELPDARTYGTGSWHRWIDTALDSPDDIAEWEKSPLVLTPTYPAAPRSVVVLIAR